MTFQNMTMYPVCSTSEKQLMKLTDIYLDGVYNPIVLSDKRIFEREGIRYELDDMKSEQKRNGIVYSEMKGSTNDIQYISDYNTNSVLLSDSNQRYISGGNPSAIANLSYEEMIRTYKKNYNPSNSFMILYGDVDYKAFLKMIDKDYLSKYKKQDVKIKRDIQKGTGKLIEKTFTYPVGKNDETKNKSVIDVAFLLGDIKKLGCKNTTTLEIALSLLNADNSKLKMALSNSKIGETYLVSAD